VTLETNSLQANYPSVFQTYILYPQYAQHHLSVLLLGFGKEWPVPSIEPCLPPWAYPQFSSVGADTSYYYFRDTPQTFTETWQSRSSVCRLAIQKHLYSNSIDSECISIEILAKPQCPPPRVPFYLSRIHIAPCHTGCTSSFAVSRQIARC
jgi:hypothetical protein